MTPIEKSVIYEKILKKILYYHAIKNTGKLSMTLDIMSDWSFDMITSEDVELKQLNILYKLNIIDTHDKK